MKDVTAPIRAFVADHCDVGPDYEVSKSDLYQAYYLECTYHHVPPMSAKRFHTLVRECFNLTEEVPLGVRWIGIERKELAYCGQGVEPRPHTGVVLEPLMYVAKEESK